MLSGGTSDIQSSMVILHWECVAYVPLYNVCFYYLKALIICYTYTCFAKKQLQIRKIGANALLNLIEVIAKFRPEYN